MDTCRCLSNADFTEIGEIGEIKLPKPVGCDGAINQISGRTAIYEVVPVDDKLRQQIHSQTASLS